MARINKDPSDFVKESTLSSLIISLAFALVIFTFAAGFDFSMLVPILLFFVFFAFMLFASMQRPMYNTMKAERLIESEIVSFIRFLKLEIRSEKSIYDALINCSKNFAVTRIYLDEIIDSVKLGKTLEGSLTEAVELCPSDNLRNVYWQLLNTLQTGADINTSLDVLLSDIVEGQKIRIEEYGRELNALSLFYMMIAIIIPTVGFTIVAAVLTFIGFPISLVMLIVLWLVLTLVQFIFLMISTQRRPSVEAY